MTDATRVACLLGDGIGPEIVPAARRATDEALAAAGAQPFDWIELPMGAEAIAATGRAIPAESFDGLERCEGWLVGPHDSESYPRSWHEGAERVPGAELRTRYDLYANIRPSRTRRGVPSLVSDVDLMIVRENTEGLYADRNMLVGSGEFMPTQDVALSVGVFTRRAIRRIAETAFELASTRRRHVTLVHKANVMPLSFGLYRDECRTVAQRYPDVELDEVLFDSMAALLVRRPQSFDVVLTENLFGDTLSDLAGELVGALGLSASLNSGDDHAMAQAAHGSAPDIAGQGVANPVGMILSAAMLLQWLGHRHDDAATAAAGRALDVAVDDVLASGPCTPDLGGTATTNEFTDAVVATLETATSRPRGETR
ncbi:MAG TPA: isocitrate/isopropylmalate dehydrogenase family protein [Gaiellaceae bacterium]